MIPILSDIISVFGRAAGKEIVVFLDKKFAEWEQKIIKYNQLKEEFSERDREALELKNDIKLAQTPEERDVLLDKMDKLFRSGTGL